MTAVLFDPTDPPGSGHCFVEASAGTGKTHAIVALATQYLAAGACTAGQLLMVTFSRSATRELRARLLHRLSHTTAVLEEAVAVGRTPDRADEVERHLLDADAAGRATHLARLQRALADIDDATVTTIHGFCDDLLRRLGDPLLGDLLADDRALATQIAEDFSLRLAVKQPEFWHQLTSDQVLTCVRAGIAHPESAIRPERSHTTLNGMRAWVAIAGGREALARRQAARQHSYDDLIHRLAAHLTAQDGATAPTTTRSLLTVVRDRFSVGLIDEFQDTDPTQWAILQALFPADGNRTLVLVGDPKQAIYSFRGADLQAYLTARGNRADRTLGMNWRADAPVVEAVTALFEAANLGPSDIAVHPLATTKPVRLAPPPTPVAFRIVDPAGGLPTHRGRLLADPARELVAHDVAAHVVQLLSDPPTVHPDREDPRTLRPHDLTILVRKNAQAVLVQRALADRHVPAVLNGVGNVLQTKAASDWLALLRALQQPTDGSRARHAALTDLVGWSIDDLASVDSAQLDALHIMLHELADQLLTHGVAAALRGLDARTEVSPRLRARTDGPRRLADLLHISELLHAEQRRAGLGLAGLVGWLEQAMATSVDPAPEGLGRRLEQADDAVEIMTVHNAKGLERGIVLLPYLWDTAGPTRGIVAYVDRATGQRCVDVGTPSHNEEYRRNAQSAAQEEEQEEQRLAYVAATRACHHLVVWWAEAMYSADSALSQVLAGGGRTRDTAEARQHIDELRRRLPDHFAVQDVPQPPSPRPWVRTLTTPDLHRAQLDREIDHGWRRYSYSRLVAGAAEGESDAIQPGADGVPPDTDAGEDPLTVHPTPTADEASGDEMDVDARLTEVVPLSGMPGGADVGTTVHRVYELLDFAAPADQRLDAIQRLLAAQAEGSPVDLTQAEGVAEGLAAVLDTPLGPISDGRPLAALRRGDRLDELDFEMPALHGVRADRPQQLLLADLADVLETHLPTTDPLSRYPAVLRAALGTVELRGFLAGQIDLVARFRGEDERADRYVVADYKTNRIAPADALALEVGHHSTAAMTQAMIHHHYPLQALIYLVATHRYLRWRLPGYDPARHLAGVAYLFVRGMTGAAAPTQPDGTAYGVFTWQPPTALVTAVDRLLADGPGAGGTS